MVVGQPLNNIKSLIENILAVWAVVHWHTAFGSLFSPRAF